MHAINVLLLSAGRRVELIRCFQNAVRRLKIEGIVIAGDSSDLAPALYHADKGYILPFINHPDYIGRIINICKLENISLIVPTIDTDLILLARNKERIESETNAKVLVSDINVISLCRDKVLTQKFLEEHQFGVPRMYTQDELTSNRIDYPLFIKPAMGSSSINALKISNQEELDFYKNRIENPVIQEYIEGEEYTVDAFLDFEGNIITVVPRLRIAARAGEVIKGLVKKDHDIIENAIQLIRLIKPIGQITIQLIKTCCNGIKYLEINPRFGGGAPMSIKSGADSCENLYRLLMGQKLKYNESYNDNLLFLRYDECVCLDTNMEIVP